MGEEITQSNFRPQDFERFRDNVAVETDLLSERMAGGGFSEDGYVVGFEIEAWLLDHGFFPHPVNEAFLERLNDPLVVPELSRFNVELNCDPLPLDGRVLRRSEESLTDIWRRSNDVAHEMGTAMVMIGTLPVIRDEDLCMANMSPLERYKALNDEILRQREGRPLVVDIEGEEKLRSEHGDVMLEAATTSFQIHLKTPASLAHRYYNASIMVSGPLLAVSTNAPYLFERALWQETRIPLFEQAVALASRDGTMGRVSFGSGYAESSLIEVLRENLDSYPPLLPIAFDAPVEEARHLRLHNGTIWRWNRPLIGFEADGSPHFRVEHRTMPSGPTIADMIANAAVYFGTVRHMIDTGFDLEGGLSFETAKENFYFAARPCADLAEGDAAAAAESARLLRCMAVAGFAAANIMLLSVSVWSGAEGTTRTLFHWISALIAVPAVLYAGRPFFIAAANALAKRTLNMDVPISLAVLLALFASLGETLSGGEQVYFEAAAMLLFFLLIGRYLDKLLRQKSRSAVADLLALRQSEATVEDADGERRRVAADKLARGDTVVVAAGERFPVDGVILSGRGDIDNALVTGESLPETVRENDTVVAGAINLSAPLKLRATAIGEDSFIGEMARLVEEVETAKPAAVTLASKAVRFYAPAVHIVAALAFAGWFIATGDWHQALLIAIATLIITCPCALGLAVPAVQVVANGVLFRSGILAKDGTALERLAEIDTVRFDKTGTLTTGRPRLVDAPDALAAEDAAAIAALARESTHPLARALALALGDHAAASLAAEEVRETPGCGIEGTVGRLRQIRDSCGGRGQRRWNAASLRVQ
jgi:hypothetical protein